MSAFEDMIKADSALFVDPAMCPEVESVVYTLAGGTTRTINVQVFRATPKPIPGTDIGTAATMRIFVRRHATAGSTLITLGADTFTVAPTKNGTPVPLPVKNIEREDAGGFMLELGL